MLTEKKFRTLIKQENWVTSVLKQAGNLYGFAIALRHWAYDHDWLPQKKAAVPVISIGNIVAGGTGKTPLVHLLAGELTTFAKIAILSRGYRSKMEHSKGGQVLSFTRCVDCGDEPRLLAQKLPETLVFVGKNRHLSAQYATSQGVELIILDDGMQHRRLARDFEVVVIDAQDPFGHGFFLPGGLLRDCPTRLKSADLIVATHLNDLSHFEEIKKQIAHYSAAPVVGMQHKAEEEANFLRGKKIGLFCAIGNPDRFHTTVSLLGGSLVESLIAEDHLPFSNKQLEIFSQSCLDKGAELLVCTEKDWVKLPQDLQSALPIYAIKVELSMVAGEEYWRQFIDKVRRQLQN